ncbi:MAG TPA: GNAT family N-acetyltransferase [Caulobacteraceae bacterium]|nr:GNAT family N-acetyltransferase [Caulobacteraceae bacterium]
MERVSELFILPAGPGDAHALAKLHVATWRETYRGIIPDAHLAAMDVKLHARRWRRQLTSPRAGEVVLVAEGPASLAGYCAGQAQRGEAEISTLYVRRASQRSGLGRRLLASAARALSSQGAQRLWLGVLSQNANARGFYEHLGGRAAARRAVRGWGADLTEIVYVWDEIGQLAGR